MRRCGFGIGVVLVIAGVALHFPDYVMMAPEHFMMAGMPMSAGMITGMALIAIGLVLALWGLLPDRAMRPAQARPRGSTERYAALDAVRLGPAHRVLVGVLFVGLVIDTMKPASLGFVAPGMVKEYGLAKSQIATLPFAGITGTVAGSLLWGYLGDLFGRRAVIMFSGVMYVATSICGFMPSFGWNLVMCGLMGISAGGMLPIVYSLMSESVPARHRGWLLVAQSGVATSLGYLIVSGVTTLAVPAYSWRILWLIGAPTGILLVVLVRWIPESPRFLLACGRDDDAAEVMARYGVRRVPYAGLDPAPPARGREALPGTERAVPALSEPARAARVPELFTRPYGPRTLGILLYGLGWGVVNWGFVTFLPVFLAASRAGTQAPVILFWSSACALPATALAAVLYAKWSSRLAMLAYAVATVVVLVLFAATGTGGSGGRLVILVGVLLAGIGGMIAMLAPYAAEVYPTALRATGSGFAAASSKFGGMLGPLMLTSAPRVEGLALISAVPVAAAALALWRTGRETSGRPLVEADVVVEGEQA